MGGQTWGLVWLVVSQIAAGEVPRENGFVVPADDFSATPAGELQPPAAGSFAPPALPDDSGPSLAPQPPAAAAAAPPASLSFGNGEEGVSSRPRRRSPSEPPAAGAIHTEEQSEAEQASPARSDLRPLNRPPQADDRTPRQHAPVTHTVEERTPSSLAGELLAPITETEPEDSQIRTMTLRQAVEQAGGRTDRTALVQLYWQLFHACAEARWAAGEAQFVDHIPAPQDALDDVLLEAERAQAAADLAQSEEAARVAQWDLAERLGLDLSATALWPADAPLVMPYRTRLKEMYAQASVPRHYQRLDEQLASLHTSVHRQASAVAARERLLETLEGQYRGGQISLAVLLETHRQLARQRRDFLQQVTRYNQQIATYAIGVAGTYVSRDGLVAMLIGKERAHLESTPFRQDVLPAAATAPVLAAPDFRLPAAEAPGDRAAGWEQSVREPTAREQTAREQSLRSRQLRPTLPSGLERP